MTEGGNINGYFMYRWLKHKDIFGLIFKMGNHAQILQRSGDYLCIIAK